MSRPIVIEKPEIRATGDGRLRASAMIDGEELWYEADGELEAAPVYEKDPAICSALRKLIARNSGPLRKWKRSLHKRWWQLRG